MTAVSLVPTRLHRMIFPSRTVAAASLLACSLLYAQQPLTTGRPITPAPADPAIAAALQQVSPDQIKATITKLVSFNNRSTLSSMDTDLAPNTGVNAAADWIESEFKAISAACGNCLEVKRDTFIEPASTAPYARITKPTRISNVYAILRGTDPAQAARMVLVTGHYDSRNSKNENSHDAAPGANDDASGVAVSLASARVLSKLKFPSTIVFVAVAGEEQGLNGSAHLAKVAKEEHWQLEAVLNNDIVGGDTTPGNTTPPNIPDKTTVRVFSEGIPANATPEQIHAIQSLGAEGDSPSRELARTIVEVDSTYFHPGSQRLSAGTPANRPHNMAMRMIPAFHPVLIFRRDRFLRGGDHTSFNQEGFAAVRFTEWAENFDHQHQDIRVENGVQFGDMLQYVDFNYVANVARLNAATLATLASAPGEPQNVRILTAALDNNSELTWQAPAGAPASTTYEVVWRETDQPVWTDSASAGAALSLKLAISKDNVVFGVRSVDPAGHRSVAVLPTPERGPRQAAPTPGKPAN
ncbi:M20/M25/M40 family metallo-hydrolase [Granulicella sp. S190]|uniref:M20/M25/M40 family metallo-hydrolase n=1 Tax=Granulicella sp. S190 TaxID=1747226 RepID=UPI00352AD78B